MPKQKPIHVAYFSMEFALSPKIPNYAGGLGVLATDVLKSCADTELRAVGVSMIYHQSDDTKKAFDPSKFMKKRSETVTVGIEDRQVLVGCYEYIIKGIDGFKVPIYFLHTNFPENKKWDRDLSKNLYPSDAYTRLAQESIFGIGGLRMLRALGYENIRYFHMNEGHAAFLTIERLNEEAYSDEAVRQLCRFTTHTPVPAGHDKFDYKLAKKVLGKKLPWHIKKLATEVALSMTDLAMNLSKRTNAVSKRHGQVCEKMFPGKQFLAITNGVHHTTWVSDSCATIYDKYLKGWRKDAELLEKADAIPSADLKTAHRVNEEKLVEFINENPTYFPFDKIEEEDKFDADAITICFARRMVPYKRPTLIFSDLDRLREIGYHKMQLIFAGNPYADDAYSAKIVSDLRRYAKELRGQIRVAFIPHYNLDIAKMLVSGADIWLNNPEPPMEASGTSGMKAAINGTLNLSILDGWWIEGYHLKPRSGWAFGEASIEQSSMSRNEIDANELYTALADAVECHASHTGHWVERMRQAIQLGSYFSAQRCVDEYRKIMWSD